VCIVAIKHVLLPVLQLFAQDFLGIDKLVTLFKAAQIREERALGWRLSNNPW
jgi:hypothetical protein